MTRRVYLHAGPFKTGSTYLQSSLRENRAPLAERGVLFPVPTGRGQQRAVIDLMERRRERRSTVSALGAWDAALEEIRSWPGDIAIVSGETLCAARVDTVERALASIAPAEVHVVVTLRNLAGHIPSVWQSNLRNRKSSTWADFTASLRGEPGADPRDGERFWRVMDVSAVLGMWAEFVPVDRLHVVVMPGSGAPPRELWDRFCAAAGIDDPPDPAEEVRNAAVGTEQAEALRRLNEGLAGQYPDYLYARFVKKVATRGAVRSATDTRTMVLPPEDFPWVRDQSQRIVDAVSTHGYHVVGDLAEVVPTAPSVLAPDGPFRPDDYRLEEVVNTSTRMCLALLEHLRTDKARSAAADDDDIEVAELAAAREEPERPGGAGRRDKAGVNDPRRQQRRERRRERRAAESAG